MKKILKTSYPCLIKTDTDSCELEENDVLEIENEQFLFIYPQNGSIPFYIDTFSEKENRFFSIIKQNDKTIFLLEKSSILSVERKQQLNFSGKMCDIAVGAHSIIFESSSHKIERHFAHDAHEYEVFKYKNFACVQFENDFYAFNIHKHKLFHFSGENLTFDNGKLSATKKIHDSMRRERSLTYIFNDDVTLEDESFISEELCNSPDLLPYKVLESAKAKDYAYIMSFLSENLKNQIDENHLNQFFGNIDSFLPLNLDEFITITSNGKNYVKFNVLNNKIHDISIDCL